jgi:hypothetical protein
VIRRAGALLGGLAGEYDRGIHGYLCLRWVWTIECARIERAERFGGKHNLYIESGGIRGPLLSLVVPSLVFSLALARRPPLFFFLSLVLSLSVIEHPLFYLSSFAPIFPSDF